MSEAELPILVAGAGIGGLTVALALARDGHAVQLLERRTRVDEVGAGIQLSPNASRILIGLGLGPALMRAGAEPERLVVRRARGGAVLAEMPLGPAMRERYGAPYVVVHRADLQTMLLDKVRSHPRVRLVFGREVAGAQEDGAGITVRTQARSGEESWRGRLLVGADGIWSRTAEIVAGKPQPPVFSGCNAWRAVIGMEDAPPPLRRRETTLWLGPGAHVVAYPIRAGRDLNVVAITEDGPASADWARPGDPGQLKARLKGWTGDVQHLLTAVREWQVWSLHDHLKRPWVKGRILLLGDAAHPVLPFLAQGGALAIEDAAVLAAELRPGERGPDLPGALERYWTQRAPRARRVQQAARDNARAYHMGLPLSLARDAALKRLGADGLRQRYEWLYGWKPPA
jgi:salicylate hydroxylase